MSLSEDANTLWQTAKALNRQALDVSPSVRALPPLLFFTDPERTPSPWETAARLPSRSAVVFRAFSADDAIEQGQKLKAACDLSGTLLLVGKDPRLAEAIKADGLHLPESDLDQADALRRRYPDWILTGAVHRSSSWSKAATLDAAILSPVFQAGGNSAAKPPLGLHGFIEMAMQAPCPVYALGGISASNAHMLMGTQACGLAGVDAIQTAFAD